MAMTALMIIATMSREPRSERKGDEWVFMAGRSGGHFLVAKNKPGREHGVGGRDDGLVSPRGLEGNLHLFRSTVGRRAVRRRGDRYAHGRNVVCTEGEARDPRNEHAVRRGGATRIDDDPRKFFRRGVEAVGNAVR